MNTNLPQRPLHFPKSSSLPEAEQRLLLGTRVLCDKEHGTTDCLSLDGRFERKVYLVSGLEHEFHFPFHIWDVILPIDELHHVSEG